MAWFKTGGGALSETVLWTNPSPTTNFASQNVTLSESFKNFKIVRFYYKASKSYTVEYYVDYTSEFLDQATETNARCIAGLAVSQGSASNVVRPIAKSSDTVLIIRGCYQISGTTAHPELATPTKICGLK